MKRLLAIAAALVTLSTLSSAALADDARPSTIYYRTGSYLKSGSTFYYQNGAYMISGSTAYFPNGAYMKSGDTFYYANGAFTAPTHGAGPYTRNADTGGAQSQYRVFGDDGVLWGSALDFGMEHGGGDEHSGERVAATTFSYRAPATRRVTGVADLGPPTRSLECE